MDAERQTVFIVLLVFLSVIFLSEFLIAQNQIQISVLSNGGGLHSNANYTIMGTVGQLSIEKYSGTNHQIHSGFWYEYEIATPVIKEETLPIVYKLEQNYPNPFNPSTIIKFAVPERSNVIIKIYDVLGGELFTLVNEEMDAGWYEKIFSANGFSSGVYIYRMEAGKYISTKKMLLIK